jgi:flagellar hook assembly protein FlgD
MLMRSTPRQRLSLSRLGALAALWALPLLLPARAQAVQIFIESAFVHRNNADCIAADNGHGVIRFRCPPIPDTVSCPVAADSCNAGATTLETPSITIIGGSNDRLAWDTGASNGAFATVVPPGTYIAGQTETDVDSNGNPSMCKLVHDAMIAADNSSTTTYHVSFSRNAPPATSGRYTIQRVGSSGYFNLFADRTGANLTNSINTRLGYTNAQHTGLTSYTSDVSTGIVLVTSGGGAGNGIPSTTPCETTATGSVCEDAGMTNGFGNISNNPHIEFDRVEDAVTCNNTFNTLAHPVGSAPFSRGELYTNYCNAELFLCASVGYGTNDTTSPTAIDNISFEIFKFQDGSNPLDEASTPPLRTFFIDAPGSLPGSTTSDASGPLGPFCALWDGAVNIQGEFGKTNGTYGYRAKTQTNQTGASGNIQITAVRAYPSGATHDADGVSCPGLGCVVTQKPITLELTNVHVLRSSPTLVGQLTPVPSEPYNLTYRLAKDATMFVTINAVDLTGNVVTPVRTILSGQTRVGEGVPNGTLSNGDFWNGRSDNGDITAPGNYLAVLQAQSVDQFGRDLAQAATRQIGLDPLQITDIRVQPLLDGSTSLAVLDYILTEPATSYVDIYPPGTQFCALTGNVNSPALDDATANNPPKDFQPTLSSTCPGARVAPLKRIVEQKPSRTRVVSFWDGRDTTGNIVNDGDYIFVMYASLPSVNGFGFNGSATDRRIWTSQAKSGFLPVIRGFVGISQVTPASTVIGSSPAIAGLNPFLFRYSLSRDATINLKVLSSTGAVIKTLVKNETRPGLFGNVERWEDGTNDIGLMVDSGTYLVQLTATDSLDPRKVSTTTAMFPVDLYRMTDIVTSPLLSGTSDILTISYQLSQPMIVWLNIYGPGTIFTNSANNWPPCAPTFPAPNCNEIQTAQGVQSPIPLVSIKGLRGGRLRITEQWDGRDANGLLVPDGQYVFSLTAQSTTTPVHFPTDKVFGTLTVQRGAVLFPSFNVVPDVPALFNSSNTITLHPFSINYSLTRQSSVTIQILNTAVPPAVVRTVVAGAVRQGSIALNDVWDGRDDRGNFPPSGFYIVRAVAQDIASQLSSPSTAQVTVSYDPLRIYDVAVSPVSIGSGGSTIFYQVSEPMKVAVKIYKPGTSFDSSGNPSPPESISLVKRIVGVKPARTEIQDVWDGTDLKLSLVPDGNYKFKIVGSTDIRAIDDLTGNVLNAGALSLDRPIDDIPVVRGASADPANDFERNTFVYPNPINTPQATFQVFLPFQSKLSMKLYNIAGDLVFSQDFGEQAPSFTSNGSFQFVWNRVNQSGRSVARGIYFAVFRAEETIGGKTVLQTVKKLLIP